MIKLLNIPKFFTYHGLEHHEKGNCHGICDDLSESRRQCTGAFAIPDSCDNVKSFPAAAYAAYAAGRGYSGYPSFGLPYPAGNALTSLHHHHPLQLLSYPLDHPLGVYGNAAAASLHAMPL
ncbi:unnamed protein product [Diabrotica balteata]|uniref:Uncharacterized protein n=1 Tax=Diabrotica balteata TaxID=107213 RepID=A0A9N9SV00_DIABA|nr:unnamed protein product [Diabrotica balteata]